MSNNSASSHAIRVGVLQKTNFSSWQEFADELVKRLIIPTMAGEPGIRGADGTAGRSNIVSSDVLVVPVPTGASYVEVASAQSYSWNLITASSSPAISLAAISTNRVHLSGPAPDDTYSARGIRITTNQ